MGRRSLKNATLCLIAGLLAVVVFAVVYVDIMLGRVFVEQKNNLLLAAHSTPVPVLHATPTPAPTPTPTPAPTRAPLPGDIADVRFPDYDTGVGADYSYQSDELRIAVTKVQENGVTYYVADIWMRNINCFRTAFSSGKYRGKRQSAEKIAKNNDAILAVNGDFLSGLVIRNGTLYRKATPRVAPTPDPITGIVDEAARPERSTCVLYYDGQLVTHEYDDFNSKTAMKKGAWQGWQFGPTLLRNGKAAKDVNPQGRNPRCMLGYYEPGHYCIVMIDGRRKGYSIGMNFKEMIKLSQRLGLTEAYNLDGGGSAIMVFDGEIINQPSGKGEARDLLDMVVIGEYLSPDQLIAPASSPTSTPPTQERQN